MFTFQSGFSPFLNFTSPLHFLSATLSLTPSFPPPIENPILQIYQHNIKTSMRNSPSDMQTARCTGTYAVQVSVCRSIKTDSVRLSRSIVVFIFWNAALRDHLFYCVCLYAESPFYCALRMRIHNTESCPIIAPTFTYYVRHNYHCTPT